MEKQNPFKTIEQPLHEVPEDVKHNIIKNITVAKQLMDIKLLFMQSYNTAIASLFKLKNK